MIISVTFKIALIKSKVTPLISKFIGVTSHITLAIFKDTSVTSKVTSMIFQIILVNLISF